MKKKTPIVESEKEQKGKVKNKKKKIIISFITVAILILIAMLLYYILMPNEENVVKSEKKEEVIVEKKLTIVDEDSNARPLAVMIDNNVGYNSHAGLQESIINYEIIVEGGLTRIMAIFKDKNVSLIGPVRSSRHYFLDYALESDAIYAHFGWSTYAETDIRVLGINNINGLTADDAYWRDRTIAAPHNVFTNIDTLYKAAESRNYKITSDDWQLLNYTTEEVNFPAPKVDEETKELLEEEKRISANKVTIPYSYNQVRSYTYDETRKVYLRFMNNIMHTDKTTGEQLYYKNIIIEQVSNYNLDSYGRQDLDTVGSGNGYYITNGFAMPIIWEKNGRGSKTIYKYEDGTELEINDGNTFIQIQPLNYQTTFE